MKLPWPMTLLWRAMRHAALPWTVAFLALILGGTTAVALARIATAGDEPGGPGFLPGKAALRATWRGPVAELAAICRGCPDLVVAMPRLVRAISLRARGQARVVTLLGLDLSLEATVQSLPLQALALDGPARNVATDPQALLLPAPLAREWGVDLGQDVTVGDGAASHTLRVRGLFELELAPGNPCNSVAVASLPVAQRVLRCPETVDAWDLVLAPGTEPGPVAARLAARLGATGEVVPVALHQAGQQARARWRATLALFALLGLSLALWVVFDALRAVVAAQRAELLVLDVLGARRALIALWAAAPGACTGAGAGVLAQLCGHGFAAALLPEVAPGPGAGALLASGGIGLLLGLVAAFLGAWSALHAAGSGQATEAVPPRRPAFALVVGFLLLGLLLVSAWQHWSRDRAAMRAVNAALAVVGLALLAPPLARGLARLLLRAAPARFAAAWLVRRRLALAPRAVDTSLRMVSLLAAFLVIAASLLGCFLAEAAGGLVGGGEREVLVVSPAGLFGGPPDVGLDAARKVLAADPAVAAARTGPAPHLPLVAGLGPDADLAGACASLRKALAPHLSLEIVPAAGLRAQVHAAVLAAARPLAACRWILAALGLLAALAGATWVLAGRAVEQRTLAVVGMPARTWRRLLLAEGLALGAGAAATAAGYGMVVAWAWTRWTLGDVTGVAGALHVPWGTLAAVAVAAPVALALPALVRATAW